MSNKYTRTHINDVATTIARAMNAIDTDMVTKEEMRKRLTESFCELFSKYNNVFSSYRFAVAIPQLEKELKNGF